MFFKSMVLVYRKVWYSYRVRTYLVVSGLSLVFAASLLLIAKPPPALAFILPPVAVSHNIPYFLYLRCVQWLFGFRSGSVMVANSALAWAVCLLVFRAGWVLTEARYR